MIKKVYFMSEMEIAGLVGSPNIGVISITSLGHLAPLNEEVWGSVLRLEFDDVDEDYGFSAKVNGYKLFEKSQAKKIIEWLKETGSKFKTVIVHCAAGISRSAAVAKFIADIYKINFNHSYSLYNKHVYKTLRQAYYGLPY